MEKMTIKEFDHVSERPRVINAEDNFSEVTIIKFEALPKSSKTGFYRATVITDGNTVERFMHKDSAKQLLKKTEHFTIVPEVKGKGGKRPVTASEGYVDIDWAACPFKIVKGELLLAV